VSVTLVKVAVRATLVRALLMPVVRAQVIPVRGFLLPDQMELKGRAAPPPDSRTHR
jgi:hypothetical protein